MKAGFYQADITPAIGMEKPGGYGKEYIDRIYDPLKVRVAVFDDGNERVALVGIDSLMIQADTIAEIRRQVEARCGIKADHLLIAASHTHNGGPLAGMMPSGLREIPELIKCLVTEHSIEPDPVYKALVIGQTVTAVYEADRRREEALLSAGSGIEGHVAFNRRFRMKNGRVYTHPGKGNPDIIEPAGPVDPEVGVLAAWSLNGIFLGCVVNYACHCTVLGEGCSADWIYYLDKTIGSCMGEKAVTVFLNGACGDVTQVNNLSPEEPEFGVRWAEKVGVRVGAEALKVMATADKGDLSPVRAISRCIGISRRRPTPDRVKESTEVVERGLKSGKIDNDWVFAKELLLADYLYKEEPEVSVEAQAVQVGPVLFLANPAEYFCCLGLDIKIASSFPLTFVVELANGCVGYIPDEEAFSTRGGGYETVLTGYSNLEPAAGRKMAETAIELAESLTPGRLPETGRAPEFVEPWDYGVRGPDLN